VTNANGCSATSAATSVTVNPLPAATITAGGPTTFCAGGSVMLTSSAGSSYLWSTGATTSSITVTTSGNYTVGVTNANGCSATSAPTTVTVNTPSAVITAPASVGANSTGNLANGPAGMTTYAWTITGGTITSATNIQNITFSAGAAGTLTLNLSTTLATCPASSSKNVTVTANGLPTITIGNVVQKIPAKGTTAPFVFTVTLSSTTTLPVTVQYFTSDQTAVAGKDYVATFGTLNIPANTQTATISVTVNGTGATTQKQFLLNLQSPTNATLGNPFRGTGVINP